MAIPSTGVTGALKRLITNTRDSQPNAPTRRGLTPWSINWYILGTVSPITKPATGARAEKPPRLDLALVERSLAPTRERAQALIMAGVVRVDGETERRPARPVPPDRSISIDESPRFVSRGGLKLERALGSFALDVTGKVCLDAGAS